MNRIDLVRFLREAVERMPGDGHLDLIVAKRTVDELIGQGILEYEDNQNLRFARRTDFKPHPVTVTFEIDGGTSGEAFLHNLKRTYPTTPMCLGPVSNLGGKHAK